MAGAGGGRARDRRLRRPALRRAARRPTGQSRIDRAPDASRGSATTSDCSRSSAPRSCSTASSTPTRTTGNAAPAPIRPPPTSATTTSASTGGTCATPCPTTPPERRRGRVRRNTTTCSAPSRRTTTTSPRTPCSPRSGSTRPQVGAAAWHGANGGIDTLIVALGANNALDAVVSKAVRWSGAGFDDLDAKDAFNVWTPTHFAQEYGRLVGELQRDRGAACRAGDRAARDDRADRQGREPGPSRREVARRVALLPVLHRPVDRRGATSARRSTATSPISRRARSTRRSTSTTRRSPMRSGTPAARDATGTCSTCVGCSTRSPTGGSRTTPEAADRNDWVPYVLPGADRRSRHPFLPLRTRTAAARVACSDSTASTRRRPAYGIVAQEVIDVLAVAGSPAHADRLRGLARCRHAELGSARPGRRRVRPDRTVRDPIPVSRVARA